MKSSFAVWLIPCLGCNFGLVGSLGDVPVCGDMSTDPDCPAPGTSSSATGDPLPTTSGADPVVTTTESTAATSPGPSTGGSPASTGDDPPAAPMIVSVALDPEDTILKASAVTVHVEALNAMEVTMTVDDGEPVSLAVSGANSYKGAIEVLGSSMNGEHAVLITATNAAMIDSAPASFTVDAPPAGESIWTKTSDVADSQTRAVAVDLDGNVYEVGTAGSAGSARMVANKRNEHGKPAWPGMALTFHDGESRGEDVAIGPDGLIYVLGNYQDQSQHTRWWLAKLDPAVGMVVGEPDLGEIDEPARGLSIANNGDVVIVGTTVVWGENDTEDTQAKVWILPIAGDGVIKEWGYSPGGIKNIFSEVPEAVKIVGERIFVVGTVAGLHDDNVKVIRKRLFVVEMRFNGNIPRTYVDAGELYTLSGGYAVSEDGSGGVVTAGWACNDVCTQVSDIHWLKTAEDAFILYDRHQEIGDSGPAFAMGVAYSPSGYNVIVSAMTMGPGLNLALRVTGRRSKDTQPVLVYTFDTPALEMGQAVTVGPHGYVWFGGLRAVNNASHAVVGKLHGY